MRTSYDPYDWLIPNHLTGATFENPYDPKRHLEIVPESERQKAKTQNQPTEQEIERLEKSLKERAKPFRQILLEETLAQIPASVREDVRGAVSTPSEERSKLQKYLLEKFTIDVTDEALRLKFNDFDELAEKIKEAIMDAKKQLTPEPKIRALYDMGGEPTPTSIFCSEEIPPGRLW